MKIDMSGVHNALRQQEIDILIADLRRECAMVRRERDLAEARVMVLVALLNKLIDEWVIADTADWEGIKAALSFASNPANSLEVIAAIQGVQNAP
jgi:hypothetical protein